MEGGGKSNGGMGVRNGKWRGVGVFKREEGEMEVCRSI